MGRREKRTAMSDALISKRLVIPPGQPYDLDLKYDPDICADRFLIHGGTLQSVTYMKQTLANAESLRARLSELAAIYTDSPLANMVITFAPNEAGIDVIVEFTPRPIAVSESKELH